MTYRILQVVCGVWWLSMQFIGSPWVEKMAVLATTIALGAQATADEAKSNRSSSLR